MKLTSPRENPYSEIHKAKESLEKKGFSQPCTVISEQEIKLGNNVHSVSNMHIVEFERFVSSENESESKAIYALETSSGEKGLLEAPYGKFSDETTDAFLRNVDTSDQIDNISQ